jgi:hypothetical protein
VKRLLFPVACLFAVTSLSSAGPVDGPSYDEKNISKGGQLEIVKTFAAGKRACVLVIGDHNPIQQLTVTVYDKQGKVVARDEGQGEKSMDFVTAVWYPPREQSYRIVIQNGDRDYNVCKIAIK